MTREKLLGNYDGTILIPGGTALGGNDEVTPTQPFLAVQGQATEALRGKIHSCRPRNCNDPAVPAQVGLLKHSLQQAFSYGAPGSGAGDYRAGASRR